MTRYLLTLVLNADGDCAQVNVEYRSPDGETVSVLVHPLSWPMPPVDALAVGLQLCPIQLQAF